METVEVHKPFIRYIINAPHTIWWTQFGAPFLEERDWYVLEPSKFSFGSSYGFDPLLNRNLHMKGISYADYCLQNAAIVVEYHGNPPNDSVFELSSESTIIDDLLTFMSIYFGGNCQYLCKETRQSAGEWSSSQALMIGGNGFHELAAPPEKAINHFEKALITIPNIDKTQLILAIQWFFSALREFEIGRPLVEASLNWVCLESQANFLGNSGDKFEKVKSLLGDQQFNTIPRLSDLYKLRNEGFHDGKLSRLSEEDAQAARTAGRALVRASVLVLLGMKHTDFKTGFVKLYT